MIQTEGSLFVDLRQMIMAIETSVSLVGMNDTNHGKRVGYIAAQFGNRLGFSKEQMQFAFDLGMIHDCGVSTEQMHTSLVNNFDWSDSQIHCQVGYRLLKDFKPLTSFSTPILYHHTHWEDLQNLDISESDKLMANLIFLADRIDITAAPHYHGDILLAREQILETICAHRGRLFKPELVDIFVELERFEAFWIALEDRHITRYTWDMGQVGHRHQLSIDELTTMSHILAYIVDQKSPFTAEHSAGVAALSRHLAELRGLPPFICQKIEIAGLMHDLGKLHIPDSILEKPGPLNKTERAIMNQHSYETYEILRHIDGIDDIARWAAFHHEGLNGLGYPFHPARQDMTEEARIIAVADVFQALVQDRPYRRGMQLPKVFEILDDMQQSGKLDEHYVELAKANAESCLQAARTKANYRDLFGE